MKWSLNSFREAGILFYLLLLLWFLINLIQSTVTDLIPDEAYYHFYSENLAWGYFDHPPLIALTIKISSLLFNNELSVRFMTVIIQLLTLIIIWKTINDKEYNRRSVLMFYGISSSIVMFVVYGFVTTPDSPLLLFTALFIFSYKRFLEKESPINCLLIAISMAGLVYSKYQGGVVILLVILSNPKLLLNIRFWLSGIAALTLLLPHIIWQIDNDFPSFMYHTVGRAKPFRFKYFLIYLPNQMANFNPFVLTLVIYILFKVRPSNLFNRALYTIIAGIIVLFWGTTLRGHAEPQWTIAASVPMIILIYQTAKSIRGVNIYLRRFVFPSIILLFILRIVIACDSIPIRLEFYNQKRWAESIKAISQDRAVIFTDGYQRPSTYKFYTKEDAFTVNSVFYRRNQYDLNSYKSRFLNRGVMIVSNKSDSLSAPFQIYGRDTIYVRYTDNLTLTSDVSILFNIPKGTIFEKGGEHMADVKLINFNKFPIDFNNKEFPSFFKVLLTDQKKGIVTLDALFSPPFNILEKHEEILGTIKFSIPENIEPGSYKLMFSIKTEPFREGFNSKNVKIEIK
ncbi:MAG: glycosyltransferase family 39 protein [Bacteroidales bacterium]|nr:glycosyltransferase family 39 protein [Bacteroidales bacterium]